MPNQSHVWPQSPQSKEQYRGAHVTHDKELLLRIDQLLAGDCILSSCILQ